MIVDEQGKEWAWLIPELSCSDLQKTVNFYCDALGFSVRFARGGFAFIERGKLQLMLEQAGDGWETGALAYPLGRGVNFSMEVDNVDALHAALPTGTPLFRPIAENWYAEGDQEHGQREFLIQDPDGYLLRFTQSLGMRKRIEEQLN
jgi:catechol 2,3-dioxygenase-like lactoylglutathione lyase family enzyme